MLEHTFCRVMFIMFFKRTKKQEAQILKTDLSPHILHFVSFIFFLQKCITYKAVRLSTHHNYSYQGHESEFSTSSLCPSCSWGTLDNPAGHLCLCHKTRRYSTRNKNSSLNSRFKKTIIIPMLLRIFVTWTFPSAEIIPCFLISSCSSATETNPSSFWSSLLNNPRNWSMVHAEKQ